MLTQATFVRHTPPIHDSAGLPYTEAESRTIGRTNACESKAPNPDASLQDDSTSPQDAKPTTAYHSPPWWYDIRGFLILTFAYQSTLWSQVKFFESNLGRRHLDVGVGTGTLLRMVLEHRRSRSSFLPTVLAVDSSERMLSGARKRLAGLDVTLLHQDASTLATDQRDFDSVCIANSLHTFENPEAALRSIRDLLSPDGVLAANVLLHPRGGTFRRALADAINRWGKRKGILVAPYAPEEIRRMLAETGYRIERSHQSGNCFFFVARKDGTDVPRSPRTTT